MGTLNIAGPSVTAPQLLQGVWINGLCDELYESPCGLMDCRSAYPGYPAMWCESCVETVYEPAEETPE
jgi:hypothetical protein